MYQKINIYRSLGHISYTNTMFNTKFIELIYKFGKRSQCPFNVLFIMYVRLRA